MNQASDALTRRCEDEALLLEEISQALRERLAQSGFSVALSLIPRQFGLRELRRDPFDGSEALYGEWFSPEGRRLGNVMIHADGKLYAEFDVVKPHPTDRRWFVEAVTAWGSRGAIKTELKLLPTLGP